MYYIFNLPTLFSTGRYEIIDISVCFAQEVGLKVFKSCFYFKP